ncbi:Trigger factor like [Quillaja saponaria]|uniref:peptidylprolyl isomerase n=1 Tax=Quillaja saponaria TaxID=32244 RepID=A0AAD7PAB1_QUISA|nr:Trigger factor like [Quillaja saponaria]
MTAFTHFQFPASKLFSIGSCCSHVLSAPNTTGIHFYNMQHGLCTSLIVSNANGTAQRLLNKPVSAVNSGLEASITDPNDNAVTLTDAKIVVESQDNNKIQIRVDLTGDQTQRVFDQVLTNLARTAPPVPGFRRQKGGKTSKVPKSFLIQIIGEERVTKFMIQEILNSTMVHYVKKENLNVKDKQISTIQTAEELKRSFNPGSEFGFNVLFELENSETKLSS